MECENKEVEETAETEVPVFVRDMQSLTIVGALPSDDVGDRCFSLLGGRVIFGLLIAELQDSFLVALPSTLFSEDGEKVDGKLVTASPVIRLMKNGVAFVCMPELEHQYYYYRFIRRLEGVLPGYFNPERMSKIDETISTWEGREKLSRSRAGGPDKGSGNELDSSGFRSPYVSTTRH